jgi:hypothetical protein
MRRTELWANSRRSASTSINDSVASRSSGKVSTSRTSPRVNPRLPAPIKAIFVTDDPPLSGIRKAVRIMPHSRQAREPAGI